MNLQDRELLVGLAKETIPSSDPSHDFLHAERVLLLAEKIALTEGGDPDVIIPAALFHDVIMYPKQDPRSALASHESGVWTAEKLRKLSFYPAEKIPAVRRAIENCSFGKNLPKESLEEHIVQDADLLESLGAIAIARTFCSTGQMQRRFYDPGDPTAQERPLDPRNNALDLFKSRLFAAKERLHTPTAKAMGERRWKFLQTFWDEFLLDIAGQ